MIGAGVLGACVAARLAEAGCEVTLLEQDRPGHAATRSSFAWLNSNDKAPRAYHDLNHAGMRAWAALAAEPRTARPGTGPSATSSWRPTRPGAPSSPPGVRRPDRMGIPGPPDRRRPRPPSRAGAAAALPAAEVAWFPDEGYLLTEPMVEHLTRWPRACGPRC